MYTDISGYMGDSSLYKNCLNSRSGLGRPIYGITVNGTHLQHEQIVQNAEYSNCDPLISELIFSYLQNGFHLS